MNNNQNNNRMQNGGQRRTPPNHNQNQRPVQRLSPEQRAALAEKRRIAELQRKRRAKQFIDKAVAIFVFSLIGLFLSLCAIFGYIYLDYSNSASVPKEPVKVTFGKDDPIFFEKDGYFHRNGEYYISLNELSKHGSFILHGNAKSEVTLTVNDCDITFDIGTANVKFNDTWSIMSGKSYFEKEQFYVPASFFTTYFNGVTTEFNSKGGKDGFNVIFTEGYSLKHSYLPSPEPIPYNLVKENLTYSKPTFISDLSKYEMYMNPENRDEYLYLINEAHPLDKNHVPSDLYDVLYTRNDRAKQKMRFYAAMALEAMFIEMRAHGFTDVSVTSAYRSYDYQSQLFNSRLDALIPTYGEQEAYLKVKEGTAVPGSSEHQSGLCADLHNLPAASEAFAAEEAYRWLYSNCANFGFILRYPKNKTDITGIMFEPWHYRYVGRYHAQKIMDSGVCLEEYMETLS